MIIFHFQSPANHDSNGQKPLCRCKIITENKDLNDTEVVGTAPKEVGQILRPAYPFMCSPHHAPCLLEHFTLSIPRLGRFALCVVPSCLGPYRYREMKGSGIK